MSRSQTSHSDHYYIGTNPPKVDIHIQPHDLYYWERRRAAQKLNRDEETLNDEPDFNPRMDVDQE